MQETKNKQTNKRGGAAPGGIFFASANAGLTWLAIPLEATHGTLSSPRGTSPSGVGLRNGEAGGMIETAIHIYCHSAAEPERDAGCSGPSLRQEVQDMGNNWWQTPAT